MPVICAPNAPGSVIYSTNSTSHSARARAALAERGARARAALAEQGDSMAGVLKLVLPKGSLEKATLDLFDLADLAVRRNSGVDYKATIDDPRIGEVRILRPQEIPRYVEQGLFDIGITGRDWVEETASDVISLGELKYSKATDLPIRVVLAVPQDSPWNAVTDLPQGVKVSSEYPEMTRRYFEQNG